MSQATVERFVTLPGFRQIARTRGRFVAEADPYCYGESLQVEVWGFGNTAKKAVWDWQAKADRVRRAYLCWRDNG